MLTPPHHQILHTVHDKDYFVLLSLPNSFIICCDSPSRFCIGGAFKMSRSCWIIATRLLKHPRYCCLSAFDTTFRVWGCKNKHPVKMAIQCLLTTILLNRKADTSLISFWQKWKGWGHIWHIPRCKAKYTCAELVQHVHHQTEMKIFESAKIPRIN